MKFYLFVLSMTLLVSCNSKLAIKSVGLKKLEEREVTLSLRIYLEGALNPSTKLMGTTLNSSGILDSFALSNPYQNAPWSISDTMAVAPGFFALNPSIVDWVLVEFRLKDDPAIVSYQFPMFLLNDGTVIGENSGSLPVVNVYNHEYLIAIKHRNHLGVMSKIGFDINQSSKIEFDFTSLANEGKISGSASQRKFISEGILALWKGDANSDGKVINSAGAIDANLDSIIQRDELSSDSDFKAIGDLVLSHPGNIGFLGSGPSLTYTGYTNVYHAADTNLDGKIAANSSPSDQLSVSNSIILHPDNSVNGGSPGPSFVIEQNIP